VTSVAVAEAPSGSGDTAPAVSCRGLTKRYGRLWALHGLDLDVPAGSSFGLIGPNGAGKSTAFGILATLLVPTSGSASVLGLNPVTQAAKLRRVLGYMPDVMGVYDNLTVEEYLRFYAAAYRLEPSGWDATIDGLLELVNLEVKRDDQVDDLSRGMKQRLSLARALVHDPQVLVLDEPASGLDPRARIELRALLIELRRLGKTVVISSHILSELEEMCTHVAIMEAGRLLVAGEPDVIRSALTATRSVVVTLAGGEQRRYTVADEAEQVALVRRLVAEEGLAVAEVHDEGGGLEQLFLQVTTGEVQ
jgi:ABC-2 type transport system ATP-binding protein